MQRHVFVQSEFLLEVEVLVVEHDVGAEGLRRAARALIPPTDEVVFVFVEDEDDELAFERMVEVPEGLRLHLHRHKGIDVVVRYGGREVRRAFRPGATVGRVKHWATHDLHIAPSDAAELMLQVTGTDYRPDADVHIGSIKSHGKHLSFDLVPSPRVNG